MPDLRREALCFDPLHGYMPFVSNDDLAPGEVSERQIIDHPWLQRLRQIHQLQTAWWVFPSAEHTRFQHVLGVMHLASRAARPCTPACARSAPTSPAAAMSNACCDWPACCTTSATAPSGTFSTSTIFPSTA